MRPSARVGALLAAPLLVAMAAAPASAQQDPLPEQVDYAVTASFDKAAYGSGDDIVATITVSNIGEVPITQVSVQVWTIGLNFDMEAWGVLDASGTALAPGEQATATATAQLSHLVDTVRLTVDVKLGEGQWDPDDATDDVVIEAPLTLVFGTVEGFVYGDRDGDGTPDPGEEMRGIRVTFSGGLPQSDYAARTGSDGRYRVELPAGRYSVSGPFGEDWLFDRVDDFDVREGTTQQLDLRARRVGQPVIRAAVTFDRARYRVGDPIRVHVTLTNPSAADVSGVVGWCSRAGNRNELPADGWGALQYGGPGVTVPARSTREFDITHTVPAGARSDGYVVANCGFIVGDDTYNSAEARAVADVPGGFVDFGGWAREVRAGGRQVPAAHVRLMLVHRSGRIAARTTTDARGRYVFRHAPANEYRIRVAGPWKVVDPDHSYHVYVWPGGFLQLEHVLVVRGPNVGGRHIPEPQRLAAQPAAAPADTPASLASTGADVGTPFLAGLLLLTTGTILLITRRRRTQA